MKRLDYALAAAALFTVAANTALAAEEKPVAKTLFTNVNVFDGTNEKLIENANVLVEGNLIKQVSTDAIEADGATVINGGGRTLMPGLIDAHWHTMLNFWRLSKVLNVNFGYLNIAAANASRDVLLRGFTTVRDAGGNCFGVKNAIDAGLAEGPRIYPSGPYIGQTSGHGDFRGPNDVP
jgi:imidazolonepropionase-like amidohydrolase